MLFNLSKDKMDEPSLSIHGEKVSQKDVLDELYNDLDNLDEFDVAIDNDYEKQHEETKEQIFYEDYGSYKVKVTPKGHDWRGLPLIDYMGELRPHYSALDKETQQVLQIQMIARLSNLRHLYSELGIPDDAVLMTYSLNVLHTYLNEKDRIVQGMKYAVFYEKAIIGTCMTLETLSRTLGANFAKNFTSNQIEVIPIYKIVASQMATHHGAGPLEGQSPTVMMAVVIAMSFGLYCGARYLKGEDGGTSIYKLLSSMASKNFAEPSSPQKEAPKKSEESRVASPLESKEDVAPSLSFNGFDLAGMMSQVGNVLPVISTLMGGDNDEKETKKKNKKKRRKYRE